MRPRTCTNFSFVLFFLRHVNENKETARYQRSRYSRKRHRFSRGSGLFTDTTHRGTGITPQETPKRQALAKGTLGDGGKPTKAPEISAEKESSALQRHREKAGTQEKVTDVHVSYNL